MVMADRYVEDIRNGRRFRGPSPANGFSEDSSDEEERGKFALSRTKRVWVPYFFCCRRDFVEIKFIFVFSFGDSMRINIF